METLPTSVTLKFVNEYRKLEKASYAKGFELIKKITGDDKRSYNHLCDHWRGKEKAFGSFYVNLSSRNQIRILHVWGITDHADLEYLAVDERKEPVKYLFGEVPTTAKMLNELMVFFLNHGVSERPASGIELQYVPESTKQFGNSANWGEYILSLSNPGNVLAILFGYIAANRMPKPDLSKIRIVDLDENVIN